MADKVIKYIKADNDNAYGLDEEVVATLAPDNKVAFIGPGIVQIKDITTADGSLSIEVTNGYGVRLTAHPFPASSRLWNGPDIIADNQYRAMLASLFHDLTWEHRAELAAAWGVDVQDVLAWGDGILRAVWRYASGNSLRGRIESWWAWQFCEFARPWYHDAKKLAGLHCLAAALMLAAAGCGTPPDWTVVEVTGTNAVLRAMGQGPQTAQEAAGAAQDAPEAVEGVVVAAEPQAAQREAAEASADGVEFADLDWCWGGFSGGGAKIVEAAQIEGLKVTSSGLSYKWRRGGCEALGATSREDADHTICALFCRINGKWRGGKFDWISTSRTTRDLKNIEGGYNGWDKSAIERAEAFAFVIVGADGRRRSNVITATR